jgi:MFS family permease
MKAWVRQGGIYIAVLLSCAAFTVISPFYSKVAKDQNIPDWLVGIIISACPSISLVLSLYLPLNIQKLGRTKALIIGMILIGSANIVLGNIIDTSANTSIIMSFISRILAGSGSAFINITSYAILVSEYPEDVSKIVAAIEISSGVGLMIGPAAGSAIFSLGGFYYSCTIIGGIMIAYAPILYLIVGPSKPYILSENNINLLEIAFKPVIII